MPDVFATYQYRPQEGVTAEAAAAVISAGENAGGGKSIPPRMTYAERLNGSVESIVPQGERYTARIRFPVELFEPGNVAQYLSVVGGALFGFRSLASVRLLDVELPESLVNPFKGPKYGISGIRHLIGTKDRPHIGTVINPRVGLTPEDTAEVAYQAAVGGVDLISDDETLTDQSFCRMEERVSRVMERLDDARCESGRQVLFAVNVSGRADAIVERGKRAIQLGANLLMVDVFTAGFSALQALAEDPGIKVPIHVHRAMHAAMTRNPEHGIAFLPLARLIRIIGGDQLYTGIVGGKTPAAAEEVMEVNEALRNPFFNLKTVFPVASGDLHPGRVPTELRALGTDVILQADGGIYGHPDGIAAGAHAMRQAVDAYMAGVSLEEYALDHYELERAIKHWGIS